MNGRIRFAIILISFSTSVVQPRIVKIDQGPVKGYKDEEYGFYAFKGIPYASAPTGLDRFKAPLPPPTWMTPLEPEDKRRACPQTTAPIPSDTYFKDTILREDCLIANIYVPDTEERNLPIVVYVHGGGFFGGYGEWFTPKQFLKENNIIYVNFNYRLGTHGFLSLGTKDIPGNAGMKDMVALLRWVNKNIKQFGGNPEDVTIQGASAGSAAVDLLMLSKSAEGLFNKVIPESGASIASFTIQSDPLANAKRHAKFLNFTKIDDIEALEHFFKTVPFDVLQLNPYLMETDSTFMFSPCVEQPTGEEMFLDKSPVDILKSGDYRKLPVLYGFANMEGLIRMGTFHEWKERMNEKFSDFLPADLKFDSLEQKEYVAKSVREFYFGDKTVSEENVLDYVNYFTDVMFAYSHLRTVKYHLANGHGQIYLYQYSFVDENTPYVPHTDVKGTDHGAQGIAFLGNDVPGQPDLNKSDDYNKMAAVLRNMWSSFIKTGKPIPEGSPISWPPVNKPWAPHMDIGKQLQLKDSLIEDRALFWDDIYSRYYRDPIPALTPLTNKYIRTDL